jgi:hypothetical protein
MRLAVAPVPRQRDLMDDSAVYAQWPDAIGHLRASLDFGTLCDDRHPAAVLDPARRRSVGRSHRTSRAGARPAKGPCGSFRRLGQTESRCHERISWACDGVVGIPGALPAQCGRIRFDVGIQEVVQRRFDRLVMGGQWPILETARRKQPAAAVGHHDQGGRRRRSRPWPRRPWAPDTKAAVDVRAGDISRVATPDLG